MASLVARQVEPAWKLHRLRWPDGLIFLKGGRLMAADGLAGARLLLVRPDHVGDVLLTLPAVAALRRVLPNLHITYLVAPEAIEVPRHCPDIDEALSLPFSPFMDPPESPEWSEALAREAPALRDRFDLALLPRPDDPWSGRLVLAAGVPVRLGYARPRTRPFLTTALDPPENGHVVQQTLDLCRSAAGILGLRGSIADGPLEGPYFVPGEAEEVEAEQFLAGVGEGEAHPLVLHPGSGWPLKNWPARSWGMLATELSRRYRTSPLVVGGPGESALVKAVLAASGKSARGDAGRLSLGGLGALQRRARLVIATDGGPLHLAALVGAPVVGVYGPADPRQFGPWSPPGRHRVVRIQLPCSPCGTLVDPTCGATVEPACVTGIGVEAVLAAVAELLGEG